MKQKKELPERARRKDTPPHSLEFSFEGQDRNHCSSYSHRLSVSFLRFYAAFLTFSKSNNVCCTPVLYGSGGRSISLGVRSWVGLTNPLLSLLTPVANNMSLL